MLTNWMVVVVLVALGMAFLTGRAQRTVRRAQHLREEALHEELF